jgi:hypothetical protein
MKPAGLNHENDLMWVWVHGVDEDYSAIVNLTVDEALELFIRALEVDKNAERRSH